MRERDQDEPDQDNRRDDERSNDKSDHGDSAPLPFAPHKDDDTPLGDTDQHSEP